MIDEVNDKPPRMCHRCGEKEPSRSWGYGIKKYCSAECHAADFWRYYIFLTILTGIIPAFGIVALIRWGMEGSMPSIDIWGWLQFTFWILTTAYFAYLAVIGYRKTRTEPTDMVSY